ncbi:hypothetical protein F5884DRAFT_231309 [Xylogone sp. PMI_703]|nr:hypothetical protein F5884DRAFT_231309 [Xylogone sp. PMI_703]
MSVGFLILLPFLIPLAWPFRLVHFACGDSRRSRVSPPFLTYIRGNYGDRMSSSVRWNRKEERLAHYSEITLVHILAIGTMIFDILWKT